MSYVLAFLGFAALIILHEAGHFVAAKAVGMRVERFSLFFGPLLVKFRRGETEYGIGPIPLGGYVKITGMNPNEQIEGETELQQARAQLGRLLEDNAASASSDSAPAAALEHERHDLEARIAGLETTTSQVRARAYYNQPVWKRVVVILAGPVVNLVIAFAIIWVLLLSDGQSTVASRVGAVERGTPAAAVLKAGDVLVSVDGRGGSATVIRNQITTHTCAGTPVNGCQAATAARIVVRRAGKLVTLEVRPRYVASAQRMEVGFAFAYGVTYPGAISAAGTSISGLTSVTGRYLSTIVRIFEPSQRRKLGSVVGGYETTQQSFAQSSSEAFQVLAVISLSLGIINLFPFLPLDGGHIFWALAEKIRGRRISFAVMERAGVVGFVLIIMLFIVGLSNDISRISAGGNFLPH